jgi:putative transposase
MAKRKTTEQKNKELAQDGLKLRHYGLRLRLVPTDIQKSKIHSFCGSSRFTYNFYLGERMEVYKNTGETLNSGEFKKSFNVFKEHPMFNWLKEADKFALETAIEAVDDAFDRFFKGQNKFPKFKSKRKSEQKYTTKFTNNNIELDVEQQMVKVPKLGWVNVRFSKEHRKMFQDKGFNAKIKSATVKYHSSGQYYVSLKCEEIIKLENEINWSLVSLDQIIGLDLGLTFFYIDSNGNKVENTKFLKNCLKKLAKLQRQLKNKEISSSNYKKSQKKISKLHLHIANMRKDFLHKESRKLVNENQVIVLEDLNVKGMIKNKKLSRSIADVSWGMFKTFVSYKSEWDNKKVVIIDRFFPSSKECNGCHVKNTLLSLSDREWVCPKCGTVHDRDINAAKNIKEEGIRILKKLYPSLYVA